jgi:hypothetical protein
MKALILIVCLLSGLNASASKDRGGGDAVQDAQGKWTLLDLAEKRAHAYFNPLADFEFGNHILGYTVAVDAKCLANILPAMNLQPDHEQLPIDPDYLPQPTTFSALHYILTGELLFKWTGNGPLYTDSMSKARKAYQELLGLPLTWIGTTDPLEDIPDEGLIRLTDPSTKKQVAIQQGGVVLVYMPIYNSFDRKSQEALIMHETLLRLMLLTNPNEYQLHGTSNLRELNQMVMAEDVENEVWTLNRDKIYPEYQPLCGTHGSVLHDWNDRK